MSELTFYYCTWCGAMAMKNFRDSHCPACHTCMKVNQVTVEVVHGQLQLWDVPAPHTDEEDEQP